MIRILSATLLLLAAGYAANDKKQTSSTASVKTVSSRSSNAGFGFSADPEAEQAMLDMANQSRAQAGEAPLQSDPGLLQAAREHAALMAAQQQLSHQFSGEADLPKRLASQTALHLDQEGENVAFALSAPQAHDGLMHSPPHRANLLNSGFNVAGIGVIRSGDRLYVAEDFGHSLPGHSAQQSDGLIAQGLERMRAQSGLPDLQQTDGAQAQAAACSMAKADSINAARFPGRYILRYTTMQPEAIPTGIARAVEDPSVKSFALGSCYGRSSTYPNGAYWVAVSLN